MAKTIMHRRTRVLLAASIGLVIAVGMLLSGLDWVIACLAGWDVAAIAFLLSIGRDFTGHTKEKTASIARQLDFSGWSLDSVVVVAALASLIAVGALLGAKSGNDQLWRIGFGLVSIILGWASLHALFMLRYAAMYYQGKNAVDFNDKEQPGFSDFAYLAFTIGMTYQVSDTNFQSSGMRKIALAHALVSFVFGTVIIATTINLVAGLIG